MVVKGGISMSVLQVRMYVYVCACIDDMCVCYVCMYVCVYVSIYMWVCMYVKVYVYVVYVGICM